MGTWFWICCVSLGLRLHMEVGVQHSVQPKCPPRVWGAGSISNVLRKYEDPDIYSGEAKPGISALEVDTAQSLPTC